MGLGRISCPWRWYFQMVLRGMVLPVKSLCPLMHQTSDIRCLTSDNKYQTSDIRQQISDICHQTSDIRQHLISDDWHQTTNIRHLTRGIRRLIYNKHQTSDIKNKHQTSDIRHLISDIWYQTSHIRQQTSDVWYKMPDITQQISDVWHVQKTTNIRRLTTENKHQTSAITQSLILDV